MSAPKKPVRFSCFQDVREIGQAIYGTARDFYGKTHEEASELAGWVASSRTFPDAVGRAHGVIARLDGRIIVEDLGEVQR